MTVMSLKALYWDSGEGKIFGMWTNAADDGDNPWEIISADVDHVYNDWAQTSRAICEGRPSPVKGGRGCVAETLITWAKEIAAEFVYPEDVTINCIVYRVDDMSDLWRILKDFDTDALDNTREGRRILHMATRGR